MYVCRWLPMSTFKVKYLVHFEPFSHSPCAELSGEGGSDESKSFHISMTFLKQTSTKNVPTIHELPVLLFPKFQRQSRYV
jgi:hypothetical protein